MSRRARRAGAAAVLAAAVIAAAAPASAPAHASLLQTSPAAQRVTPHAPGAVALTFSEPVEPRFAVVSVTDREGRRLGEGAPVGSPAGGHARRRPPGAEHRRAADGPRRGPEPRRGAAHRRDRDRRFDMLDMDMGQQSFRLAETRPGVYRRNGMPLIMVGNWGVTFEVTPKAGAAYSFLVVDHANG